MALFFTVLLGLSVSILVYFGYFFNRAAYVSVTDMVLSADIANIDAWQKAQRLEEGLAAYGTEGRVYLLEDKNGQRIAGNIDALPDSISVLQEGTILFHLPGQQKLYAARVHTLPDGQVITLGMDVSEQAQNYKHMSWLAGISIVFLVLVILTSFAISTFVVGRTGLIAKTASAIMDTGDLSRRIDIDARWDDIGYVAEILNRLLARIEELMQGIRQVSSNIAHDLRTPLTRLRNNLEMLQSQAIVQNDAQTRELCETLSAEAEQILSTFAALLRIARIETGWEKSHFQSTAMDEIIKDACELYEPLAAEKTITIKTQTKPKTLQGDRDLLFQMVANLIDNAIKYTPAGGTINLSLTHAEFSISDTGPGVSEAEHKRIFERFYRAEQSRTSPGTGLGLSLVAAIAQLHGFSIKTQNLAPGLQIRLIF